MVFPLASFAGCPLESSCTGATTEYVGFEDWSGGTGFTPKLPVHDGGFGLTGSGWCWSSVRFVQVMLSPAKTSCVAGWNAAVGPPGVVGVTETISINQSGMVLTPFVWVG